MLMKTCLFASADCRGLWIFHSKRFVAWQSNYRTVNNRDRLRQLHLVAKLVVKIHTGQKQILDKIRTSMLTYKLWMSVNPSQRHNAVRNLRFEQLHFAIVCHAALILLTDLRGDNQGIDNQLSITLYSCQYGTCFKLLRGVCVRDLQKICYDVNRADDRLHSCLITWAFL